MNRLREAVGFAIDVVRVTSLIAHQELRHRWYRHRNAADCGCYAVPGSGIQLCPAHAAGQRRRKR